MRVIGTRRRQAPVPHVDAVLPPRALAEVLPRADYVVRAYPLTVVNTVA